MSNDFTPSPLAMYGRIDTSAGEGGESLHKVNPHLFGVSTEGTIGRGSEVDGDASPDDIQLQSSTRDTASTGTTTDEPRDDETPDGAVFNVGGGTVQTSGQEGVHHNLATFAPGDPMSQEEADTDSDNRDQMQAEGIAVPDAPDDKPSPETPIVIDTNPEHVANPDSDEAKAAAAKAEEVTEAAQAGASGADASAAVSDENPHTVDVTLVEGFPYSTAPKGGYDAYTAKQLQEILRAREEPVSGNKDELVARVKAGDKANAKKG